jgi:thiol-disulfide isomerase/thioredoxin
MNVRRWITAVAVLVAAGAAVTAVGRVTVRQSAVAHETRETVRFLRNSASVPAFSVQDFDGRAISYDDFRGKVVLVNFWATWCPPCRAEIPDLVALQDRYRGQLQIIGISEDEGSPEGVRRFAAEHKINYPVAMATPEIERIFAGVSSLPTSFLIDRNGRIVQKHLGMLNAKATELETRVLAGLAKNVTIELVDPPKALGLENAAQAKEIPGVDLTGLSPEQRTAALQTLNTEACTCGCGLTVAKCRIDDPSCGVSLPLARKIVEEITNKY